VAPFGRSEFRLSRRLDAFQHARYRLQDVSAFRLPKRRPGDSILGIRNRRNLRMRSASARCLFFVFITASVVTGCSKSGFVRVEGIVLLENEPVAEATVLFIPEGGTG